jgi:GTP-binding protein HflX
MQIVERVLGELQAGAAPRLTVLNKIDLLPRGHRPFASEPGRHSISARTGEGIPGLLEAIDSVLQAGRERLHIWLPAGRGDLVARLRQAGTVLQEDYRDGQVEVTALVPPKLAGQVRKAIEVDS